MSEQMTTQIITHGEKVKDVKMMIILIFFFSTYSCRGWGRENSLTHTHRPSFQPTRACCLVYTSQTAPGLYTAGHH